MYFYKGDIVKVTDTSYRGCNGEVVETSNRPGCNSVKVSLYQEPDIKKLRWQDLELLHRPTNNTPGNDTRGLEEKLDLVLDYLGVEIKEVPEHLELVEKDDKGHP